MLGSGSWRSSTLTYGDARPARSCTDHETYVVFGDAGRWSARARPTYRYATMPFQNRVTPGGELIAVAELGTLTGNRGVLHNDRGEIVRRSQVRRWITCVLAFGNRHRVVMTPRRYTHLFFLDDATALAAGHRPCGECRNADYQQFRRCWAAALTMPAPPRAESIDDVLHHERALADARRRTGPRESGELPDGVFVDWQDGPWLVCGAELLRWTPGGYTDRRTLPRGQVAVLTPPTTVAVIRAGFSPRLHPSASAQ
jgi:hypothetical protein